MNRWVGRALLGVIAGYQRFVSPITPASCRFNPTCSEYARQSIDQHGALKGSGLAIRRLLRCHPFGGHGYDPVPPTPSDPQNEGRSIPAGKEAV
jgi:putative membrane protein insertion efficiency factor